MPSIGAPCSLVTVPAMAPVVMPWAESDVARPASTAITRATSGLQAGIFITGGGFLRGSLTPLGGGELLRRSRRARRDTETQPRNRAFAVRSHTVQTERPRGNVQAVQALRERSPRMRFYVSEMVRLEENPRHATGHATRDGSS